MAHIPVLLFVMQHLLLFFAERIAASQFAESKFKLKSGNGNGNVRKLIVSENDESPLTESQRSELLKSCPGVLRVQKIDILSFDIIHMEDSIDVVECATDWLYEHVEQVNLVAEDEEMKPSMMLQKNQDLSQYEQEKRGKKRKLNTLDNSMAIERERPPQRAAPVSNSQEVEADENPVASAITTETAIADPEEKADETTSGAASEKAEEKADGTTSGAASEKAEEKADEITSGAASEKAEEQADETTSGAAIEKAEEEASETTSATSGAVTEGKTAEEEVDESASGAASEGEKAEEEADETTSGAAIEGETAEEEVDESASGAASEGEKAEEEADETTSGAAIEGEKSDFSESEKVPNSAEDMERDLLIPNDKYFSDQWAFKEDANIDAPEAWALLRNRMDIEHPAPTIVAVIDSGVRYDHEDLKNTMWINMNEIPNNGFDDDENGYIDDIHGIDVENNDGDPMDDGSTSSSTFLPGLAGTSSPRNRMSQMLREGHGTHVAGIIAASGNNGKGITGIAGGLGMPKNAIKIMAIKVGSFADCLEGMAYALKHGARISNWSVGTFSGISNLEIWREIFSKILKYDPDHVTIAAADNNDHHNRIEVQNVENLKNFEDLSPKLKDQLKNHEKFNSFKKHEKLTMPCGVGLDLNVICVASTNRNDEFMHTTDELQLQDGVLDELQDGVMDAEMIAKKKDNKAFHVKNQKRKGKTIVHIGAPGEDILSTHVYSDLRKSSEEFRRLYKQGPIPNHPLEKDFTKYDRGMIFGSSASFVGSSAPFVGSSSFGSSWTSSVSQTVAQTVAQNSHLSKFLEKIGSKKLLKGPSLQAREAESKTKSYKSLSGTSVATPHVTGLVVLLKTVRPQLSSSEIIDLVLKGADRLPEKIYDFDIPESRRLNLYYPLKQAFERYPDPPLAPKTHIYSDPDSSLSFRKLTLQTSYQGSSVAMRILLQLSIKPPDDLCHDEFGNVKKSENEAESENDSERSREKNSQSFDFEEVVYTKSKETTKKGEVQIWFLNAQKERIGDKLHTRRIDYVRGSIRGGRHNMYDGGNMYDALWWQYGDMSGLGGMFDERERYVTFDRWDLSSWNTDLLDDKIQTQKSPPILLELTDQVILPEARYIAAFTAFLPDDSDSDSDFESESDSKRVFDQTQKVRFSQQPLTGAAGGTDAKQYLTMIDLKEDDFKEHFINYYANFEGDFTRYDRDSWARNDRLKVRIDIKWQNADAVYTQSLPALNTQQESHNNDKSNNDNAHTSKDLTSSAGTSGKLLPHSTNADMVISFIPPVSGEAGITHYNIYKGQWVPCGDESDINDSVISNGSSTDISESNNAESDDTNTNPNRNSEHKKEQSRQEQRIKEFELFLREQDLKDKDDEESMQKIGWDRLQISDYGRLCWAYCLPREVDFDTKGSSLELKDTSLEEDSTSSESDSSKDSSESSFDNDSDSEKNSDSDSEKTAPSERNILKFEARKCSKQATEKTTKFAEGAYLKSIPVMNYAPPYCKYPSNQEEPDNLIWLGQGVCKGVTIVSKTTDVFELNSINKEDKERIQYKNPDRDVQNVHEWNVYFDRYGQTLTEGLRKKLKDSSLWRKYGPAIHSSTVIEKSPSSPYGRHDPMKLYKQSVENEYFENKQNELVFYEEATIVITGPGILTVDNIHLPDDDGILAKSNSLRASLSYKGLKFQGEYESSDFENEKWVYDSSEFDDFDYSVIDPDNLTWGHRENTKNSDETKISSESVVEQKSAKKSKKKKRFPDITIPEGKHHIEWEMILDINAYQKMRDEILARPGSDEKDIPSLPDEKNFSWKFTFHSTARYENIHVHVPDINVKDDDFSAEKDILQNPDEDFIPSSILIVPAFRKRNTELISGSYFNRHQNIHSDFAIAESHIANGIDIAPPPTIPPYNYHLESLEEKDILRQKRWLSPPKGGLLKDGILKPAAVQFLDTNPDRNAFSGKVKIIATRENIRERKGTLCHYASTFPGIFVSSGSGASSTSSTSCRHDFCTQSSKSTSQATSQTTSTQSASSHNSSKKQICTSRIRLTASLHWYDNTHAEESMAKLWIKESAVKEGKKGDEDSEGSEDEGDSDSQDSDSDWPWIPNPYGSKKQWNVWHYFDKKTYLNEKRDDEILGPDYMGDVNDDGGSLMNQFPYRSTASGMLWKGSCYAEVKSGAESGEESGEESGDASEGVGKISEDSEISCTIDMEDVKLDLEKFNAVSKRISNPPKKWRMFAYENTIPTDVVNLPSLSTLIVPVYDVNIVPPGGSASVASESSVELPSVVQGFELARKTETGENKFWEKKNDKLWEIMRMNTANLGGPQSIGLTGFRWYWENTDFMRLNEEDSAAASSSLEVAQGKKILNHFSSTTTMSFFLQKDADGSRNQGQIKLQKDEDFLGETMLPVVCPPVFSNHDVTNVFTTLSESGMLGNSVATSVGGKNMYSGSESTRRFATSPGFPGCEINGPFAPRCYSSEFYPQGSTFDSCTNGGWEITPVVIDDEEEKEDEKDENSVSERRDSSINEDSSEANNEDSEANDSKDGRKKLAYSLKKAIKFEHEHESIYFPTAGTLVLREFKGLQKWEAASFSTAFSGTNSAENENLFESFSSGYKFERYFDQAGALHFHSGLSSRSSTSSSVDESSTDEESIASVDEKSIEESEQKDSEESIEDSEQNDSNEESIEESNDSESYFIIHWIPHLPDSTLSPEANPQQGTPPAARREPLSLNLLSEILDANPVLRSSVLKDNQMVEKDTLGGLTGPGSITPLGHNLFKHWMPNMAGSLRVVPVYHNYLQIRQQSLYEKSSSVAYSVDSLRSLPRYSHAAFRAEGVSVSLNLRTLRGECTKLRKEGTSTEMEGSEKEGSEISEQREIATEREMTCRIPPKVHRNLQRPLWTLKSVHEEFVMSAANGSSGQENLKSVSAEIPEYCHKQLYFKDKAKKVKEGEKVQGEEKTVFFKFPIGECGSSMHAAFDYESQQMKTFASVLIVYDKTGDQPGNNKKHSPQTFNCRCEIGEDSSEGDDDSSSQEEDPSSQEDGDSSSSEDDPGNRRLLTASGKMAERTPVSDAKTDEKMRLQNEEKIILQNMPEELLRLKKEQQQQRQVDRGWREEEAEMMRRESEKRKAARKAASKTLKESDSDKELVPENIPETLQTSKKQIEKPKKKKIMWKLSESETESNALFTNLIGTESRNATLSIDSIHQIDLTMSKSAKWAIGNRNLLESALKDALLSGCGLKSGVSKNEKPESSSTLDRMIESVIITEINEVYINHKEYSATSSKRHTRVVFLVMLGSKTSDQAFNRSSSLRHQLESRIHMLVQNAPRILGKFLHGVNRGFETKTGEKLGIEDIKFSRHLGDDKEEGP